MATYDTNQIETLRQVDVLALATEVYGAQLEKWTPVEVAGACPCPGCTAARDGFHVNTALNRWKCYSCHPGKWFDAPELVKAVERVGFRQAAEKLLTGNLKRCDVAHSHITEKATSAPYRESWARGILESAQDRLWSATQQGEQARGYLAQRGLLSPTWEAFGLGVIDWMDFINERRLPSIVIPWYNSDGSHFAGLRYRHMETDGKIKYRVYGSIANRLFGWQANTLPADTVILCEGELNALSIYQATLADGIHVFSVGSQTNRLAESIVAHVSTYRRAIVWMDEPDQAQAIAEMLPNAVTIDSASMGGDANQLLTANRLSEIVRCLL